MKTILITGTFLEGVTYHGCSRLERTIKWLEFYTQPEVKEALGFDRIVATDNASPIELLKELSNSVSCNITDRFSGPDQGIADGDSAITIIRHDVRLAKKNPEIAFGADYDYVWRQLWDLNHFAQLGLADKFLRIDNDAYILTKKLAHFIRDQNSGFVALTSGLAGMPEDAIMVLNKDAFPNLNAFCRGDDYLKYHGQIFENVLPLTGVAKQFVGGRYGEQNPPLEQKFEHDYYCQRRNETALVFERLK
jgi:hypothetical protein